MHGPPPARQAESRFHYFVLFIVIKGPGNVSASDSIKLGSASIRNELIFQREMKRTLKRSQTRVELRAMQPEGDQGGRVELGALPGGSGRLRHNDQLLTQGRRWLTAKLDALPA